MYILLFYEACKFNITTSISTRFIIFLLKFLYETIIFRQFCSIVDDHTLGLSIVNKLKTIINLKQDHIGR